MDKYLYLLFFVMSICLQDSTGVIFRKRLYNITAVEGGTVVFRCKTKLEKNMRGDALKRTWTNGTSVIYANGDKYPNDDRISLVENTNQEYSVQVHSVSVYDEGKYTCTMYLDEPQESSLYLVVNVPAQFTSDTSSDITLDEGSSAMLKCIATGKPKPRVTWRHLVPSADGVRATGTHLPLTKITREGSGMYECTADNKIAAPNTHRIKVTVNYPPEFSRRNNKLLFEQALGREALLECEATSIPEPVFTWHHPNKNVYQDSFKSGRIRVVKVKRGDTVTSKFIIDKAAIRDFGNYTCIAGNKLGYINRTMLLKRIFPEPTRPPPSDVFSKLQQENSESDGDGNSASSLNILNHRLCKLVLLISPVLHVYIASTLHK